MTIYEFSCDFYFQQHYDVLVMVEYLKKVRQITQKDINEAAAIPKSNFRRAQMKEFDGYEDIIQKMADHLGIPTNIDRSVIAELDELFSRFYTSICFSVFKDAEIHYRSIQNHFAEYENSILLVPYYLAQLIYHVSEVNYTNKVNHEKINEAIRFLKHFVDKMSNEHRFLYYEYMAAYAGIMKDQEKVVHFARLTVYLAANYAELEPTANYHVSFSYSLVGDFINALIYANKALPKLEDQLNYTKAVFCRMNIATLYKKLGNIDEAKRMLKKNLVYLNFNELPRLDRVTYLNYADCCLIEKNYAEAIKYYNKIINTISKRHDYESIMLVYGYYMMNQTETANAVVFELQEQNRQEKFSAEYLSLIEFFHAYFNQAPFEEIEAKYRKAEALMPGYRFRGNYIQDQATALFNQMTNRKSSKAGKLHPSDEMYLV